MLVPFHSTVSVAASTSAVTHVALEMASRGVRTVLLDLAPVGGAATSILGAWRRGTSPGLTISDVLDGRATVSAVVQATGIPNMFVAGSGKGMYGRIGEGTCVGRMHEVRLYEQMEALDQNFDVTLVALPDRLVPEAAYVLARASGVVAVVDPSRPEVRPGELYRRSSLDEPLVDAVNLLAVLPYGRDANSALMGALSDVYGELLLMFTLVEEFHERAVFAGLPLRMVEPAAPSAWAMSYNTGILLKQIAHRSGHAITPAEKRAVDEEQPSAEDLRMLQRDFRAYVSAELARIGREVGAV